MHLLKIKKTKKAAQPQKVAADIKTSAVQKTEIPETQKDIKKSGKPDTNKTSETAPLSIKKEQTEKTPAKTTSPKPASEPEPPKIITPKKSKVAPKTAATKKAETKKLLKEPAKSKAPEKIAPDTKKTKAKPEKTSKNILKAENLNITLSF